MTPKPIEQRFFALFGREQAFWTAVCSLTAYNLALIVFGFSPTFFIVGSAERTLEYFVGTLSVVALVFMWGHSFNRFVVVTRWAYLMMVFGAILTIILFFSGLETNLIDGVGEVVVLLLILTGGLVATSMHIEHGGRKTLRRHKG
jgi:hypothetical protein